MLAQVKFITSRPVKVKDREDEQSYELDVNQKFYCGDGFLGLMAPNETMPHMSRDHESWATNDGNHVMVPNPNEMISIVALVTRINTWMPKP
jgi:hypothetical protein